MDISIPFTCSSCKGEIHISPQSFQANQQIVCQCGEPFCKTRDSQWLAEKIAAIAQELRLLSESLEKLEHIGKHNGLGACEVCHAALRLKWVSPAVIENLCKDCQQQHPCS